MSTQAGPPEREVRGAPGSGGSRPPAMARYWWLTSLRGLVALLLALAIAVAGRSSARLVTFLALFWMTGGLITLRSPWPSGLVPGSGCWRRPPLRWSGPGWSCFATDSRGRGPRGVRGLLASCGAHGVLRVLAGSRPRSGWGRRWTLGDRARHLEFGLGALLLLTSGVEPDLLAPLVAAWGAVSGILLLTQGLQLRRVARSWRGSDDTPSVSDPTGGDPQERQPRNRP